MEKLQEQYKELPYTLYSDSLIVYILPHLVHHFSTCIYICIYTYICMFFLKCLKVGDIMFFYP